MTVAVSRGGPTGFRTVDVRGFPLRFRVQGSGDPLLLLNGLTRPLESWEPFTAAIRGRQVISVDAPGVGASAAPRLPVPVSLLAGLAMAVLDEVGVARADVLGFSHGGAVAQQLAIDAPGRVRRLVLAATSCGVGASAGHLSLRRLLAPPGDDRSWPRPDALGTMWHALAISGWSSIPFLGAIAARTLVVSGERDRVVPPGNSRLLARRIPGAELALLAAGHDLQRSGPAQLLADAVDEFLQRKDSDV
jgi:poly(3-hydroxyoctanoate) depolymerase